VYRILQNGEWQCYDEIEQILNYYWNILTKESLTNL
jgi:hypothetical protein